MNGLDKYGSRPHGAMGVALLEGQTIVIRSKKRVGNKYGFYNKVFYTVIDPAGAAIGHGSIASGKLATAAKTVRAWAFSSGGKYIVKPWNA